MKQITSSRYRNLIICGISAPFFLGLVITVTGCITPGYNQVTDSISFMGITEQPCAWLLNTGYYVYGILLALAAWGLYRTYRDIYPVKVFARLLAVHSIGTVFLAVFPDSLTSVPEQLLHNAVSALSYVPLLAGIWVLRGFTRTSTGFRAAGYLGMFTLFINLPIPFVHMVEPLSHIGGLLQRIFSFFSFLWLACTFYILYRETQSIYAIRSDSAPAVSVQVKKPALTGSSDIKVGNVLQ